jgi:hypothetical protein
MLAMEKQNESSSNVVAAHYEDVEKVEPSIKRSKDIGAQFLAGMDRQSLPSRMRKGHPPYRRCVANRQVRLICSVIYG